MANAVCDFGYKYEHVTASAQISSGACVLHSIVINGLTTVGDATVYDNPAAAGNIIAILHLNTATSVSVQPITLTYDIECVTGLYISYGQGLATDLTISFR